METEQKTCPCTPPQEACATCSPCAPVESSTAPMEPSNEPTGCGEDCSGCQREEPTYAPGTMAVLPERYQELVAAEKALNEYVESDVDCFSVKPGDVVLLTTSEEVHAEGLDIVKKAISRAAGGDVGLLAAPEGWEAEVITPEQRLGIIESILRMPGAPQNPLYENQKDVVTYWQKGSGESLEDFSRAFRIAGWCDRFGLSRLAARFYRRADRAYRLSGLQRDQAARECDFQRRIEAFKEDFARKSKQVAANTKNLSLQDFAAENEKSCPPPVDNDHVAPGCEPFSEATIAAAKE